MAEEPPSLTDAERLFSLALECIEQGELKRALKVARHLERMRFTGAYEIRALIQIEKGEPDKAITVLRRGVRAAPESWRLWELLGNLFSDSSAFDEAQAAYDRALTCPACDRVTVLYNSSLAFARQGLYDRALERVRSLGDAGALEINASLLQASLLTSLRRADEAIGIAQAVITRLSDPALPRDTTDDDLAAAYSELARAHWEGRCDATEALRSAWKALEHGRRNYLAMKIVREARGQRSAGSRRYHILMKGRWHEPFEGETVVPGFYRNYEVIAQSPLECLEYVRELEHEAVRDSLEIESVKAVEDCPDEPKGLVAAEGYMFWEQEDHDYPFVTN